MNPAFAYSECLDQIAVERLEWSARRDLMSLCREPLNFSCLMPLTIKLQSSTMSSHASRASITRFLVLRVISTVMVTEIAIMEATIRKHSIESQARYAK